MSKAICPYCSEKFNSKDILFRCINPNSGECPFEEDKEYSKYWRFTRNKPMNKIIEPELSWHERVPESAICTHCHTKSTKKVCPFCHNELPHTAGHVKEYTISIIGAKEAGKSHYVAVLINALKQYIGQKLDAALVALNDETINRYQEEFYNPLYIKKEKIRGTISAAADLKAPLIYRFSIKKKNIFKVNDHNVITLVFFDTAGEDLEKTEIMRREVKYISNSSGIIFLLDPLQIPAVREKLPVDTILPNVQTSPDDIITRVINLIKEDHKNKKEPIKIPVALTFSKIDALHSILQSGSSLRQVSPHDSLFDIDDCEIVSSEIQAYLQEWVGPNISNTMEHNFKNFSYFALSALGGTPNLEGKLTDGVSPFRIEDPFLWLLWKNKLIEGRRAKK